MAGRGLAGVAETNRGHDAAKIKVVPIPLAQPPFHDQSAVPCSRNITVAWHGAGCDAAEALDSISLGQPLLQRRRGIDAPAPLRLWHLASFDAPTVAVVWSLAFAWVAHVRLPVWVPVLLSLAVWTVYVGDRLLDARAGLRAASLHRLRERHLFHWSHRRVLLPLAVAAASAAWVIFVMIPAGVRERDSLLAAASLVYFTGVHSGRKRSVLLSKEFLVGILFTAGCALPAWSRTALPYAWFWPLLIPVVYFALLAWLNCYAIERWETDADSTSRRSVWLLGLFVAIAGAVTSAALLVSQSRSAALLVCGAVAAFLLALLDRFRNRLSPVALRTAADLVLLTPALLIPLAAQVN